jgi:hypothetical protein
MFKLKTQKILSLLGLTLASSMVLAATDIQFHNVRTPTPESKYQSLYIPGTSFRIEYGAAYISDIYNLIGTSGTTNGSLYVKEDKDPSGTTTDLGLRPRRIDSSFQTKNQGPLVINAAWDGFKFATQLTTSYKTDLNRLVNAYIALPNKNTNVKKVIHFYLPNSNFGTADFQTYAQSQVGVKNLRPNTFRTKSITGGTVIYEYCRNANNEAMYIRNCTTNGNLGTIGTFTVEYLTSIGTGTKQFCWHNYDRDENGQITVNGTVVSTAVACVN